MKRINNLVHTRINIGQKLLIPDKKVTISEKIKVPKNKTDNAERLFEKAYAYFINEKYRDAVQAYQQANKIKSGNADAYYHLGFVI